MSIPAESRRQIRFGEFRVDLETAELRNNGNKTSLQGQPLQILALLLERPGKLVTREELKKKLWPSDTFVDFDQSLNRAVNRLREALDDSADQPRFIETLPRRGYRFIAPVIDGGGNGIAPTGEAHESIANRVAAIPLSSGPEGEHSSEGIAGCSTRSLIWAVAVVAVVLTALTSRFLLRLQRPLEGPFYLSIALPAQARDIALSPDGNSLAFVGPAPDGHADVLWIRSLRSASAKALPGSEGASYPFWSPDDREVAFFADGKLRRVPSSGGAVQVICDAPSGRGGSWSRDDIIVFTPQLFDGMFRVPAGGGAPVKVTNGNAVGDPLHRWPTFLPDGKHFLFLAADFGEGLPPERYGIFAASLAGAPPVRLLAANSNVAYAAPGYLLFVRDGSLLAQRFDSEHLRLAGDPFAVANGVLYRSESARAVFSVSHTGELVYEAASGGNLTELAWYDRLGKHLAALGPSGNYFGPRLSWDGLRVAFEIGDLQSTISQIWVSDARAWRPSRLTFEKKHHMSPIWAPDGKRMVFAQPANRVPHVDNLFEQSSEGSSNLELLDTPEVDSAPSDWSHDGRFVFFVKTNNKTNRDIWVLPMFGERKAYGFLRTEADENQGQLSPDGHWLAYSSNQSGKWEVYAVRFPNGSDQRQVSSGGGRQPRWRADGKELFYLSMEKKMMSVSVSKTDPLLFGSPLVLFQTRAHDPVAGSESLSYDVSPDGKQFLINTELPQEPAVSVDIVLHWSALPR
jgi:Tol biopolymer transport system component/DNA-binding winged helix-turn-helix (wHTH) protein